MAAAPQASDFDTPSPFRRFPWVQIAFCLACLTMTGYTWMRYSYAWEVDLDDPEYLLRLQSYTRVRGVLEKNTSVYFKGDSRFAIVARTNKRAWVFLPRAIVRDDEGRAVSIEGRMTLENLRGMFGLGIYGPVLDTTASRFHPTSIAGLAVGAMGCFIFGLYLRRWRCERAAA